MEIDHKLLLTVIMPLLLLPLGPVQGDESWQLNRLLKPDANALLEESNGSVFIYDGLFESDIDFALTDQFHRMESMMFIRTKVIADGEVEEADDCS